MAIDATKTNHGHDEKVPDGVEVLDNPELMNDAFDAENREHEMGVWQAAKAHPWACFWAFVMCFTIVSPHPPSVTSAE